MKKEFYGPVEKHGKIFAYASFAGIISSQHCWISSRRCGYLARGVSNLDDLIRKEEAFLQDMREAMMNDEVVEQEDEFDEELLDDETEDLYAAREMTRAKPHKKNKMKPNQSLIQHKLWKVLLKQKGKGKKAENKGNTIKQ